MDIVYSKSKNFKVINFSNPSEENKKIQRVLSKNFKKIILSNQYILGSHVNEFEKKFSRFFGRKYSIGVASGTDAIELSIRALGIGKGDEIITVSHTAFATVNAICLSGATPVLIDIDKENYCIDINKIKSAITKKTKAIIPVHLYGQSSDMIEISQIAKKYKLKIIEDVSQAHGAKYRGKYLGNFSSLSCFSFYPTKNLSTIGDGGMITTNSFVLYKKLKMLREYGWNKNRVSFFIGRNSRLDEIHAMILNEKLKNLKDNIKKRNKIAQIYFNHLDHKKFNLPKINKYSEHAFHLFVIESNRRNQIIKKLNKKGINLGIHYPIPVHKHPSIKKLVKLPAKLKITEKIAKNIISLPIYPDLKKKHVHQIIKEINKA